MGAQAVRLSNVDIDNALENKDFEVLFQPLFDLGNGALARMESFVRWRHPSLGVLPPGAFISFFENQGRMGELTCYVLEESLNHYLDWRGPYPPGFSINLALADLHDEAFAPHLVKVLRDHDFPADLVTLECPMPPVDADAGALAEAFDRLGKTGARLAIEVRGRANDFLKTIDPFPFDEIKTGGSSILRFARTVRGPGLSAISDLLEIAKNANAVTTAVGVEDQSSLAALRSLGFSAAQGNHLAKVGAISEFRPSHVNDVRELLELNSLTGEELGALFRTAAPTPTPAGAASDDANDLQADEASDDEQDRDDREAQGSGDPAPDETTVEPAEAAAAPEEAPDKAEAANAAEDARKAAVRERALKKAKAIALAKRAKARDARKAAAIKRAKAKAALQEDQDGSAAPCEAAGEASDSFPDSSDPRDLQNRIQREFSGAALDIQDDAQTEQDPHDHDASEENDPVQADLLDENLTEPAACEAADDGADQTDYDDTVASGVAGEDDEELSVEFDDEGDEEDALTSPPGPEDDDQHLSEETPAPQSQPAQPAGSDNAPRTTDAASPPAPLDGLKMPVSTARALFRPGISVPSRPRQGGLLDIHAGTPASPQGSTPDETPENTPYGAHGGDPSDDADPYADELPSAAKAKSQSIPEKIGAASLSDLKAAPKPEEPQPVMKIDENGNVEHRQTDPDAIAKAGASMRRRKARHPLSRRYRLLPDHFWPKSWRRKYMAWKTRSGASAD